MKGRVGSFLRRLRGSERGAVTVFAAIGSIAFIGFGAITVDVAYVFHAKRVLQASSDAAALAGAMQISCCGATSAVDTANTYSGAAGKKNANPNLTVTANPQTMNCTGTTGATCTPDVSSPNGIQVTQSTDAPLYFARIFRATTLPISTTAYALAAGGKTQQVDVVVIVDTTGSMNTADTSCSIVGATRVDCALAGLRALLQGFTPPQQQVALMLFPGLNSSAEAAQEYDCSSTTPSSIAQYNASPVYLAVPFSTDFNTSGTLDTNSNLVKAARGGAAGCTAGVSAIGGAGTFYADVVTAAQNYLVSSGRSGVQKMIIVLSDGDANSPSAPTNTNECQQAITAAQNAQAAKTTVVTIAYGAPTAGSCSTDTVSISACETLLKMASTGSGSSAAPQWFYSDTTGGTSTCTSGAHSITDLSAIFQDIGSSLTGARLIPSS
jgi:Flp pilus assembly protein TadG